MGKNSVREEWLNDGTWTCPAGVTQVRAKVYADLRQGQVVGAGSANMALTATGDAYAWGNASASFPNGTGVNTPVSSPVIILGGLKWRSLYAGQLSNLGLSTSGDLYGWGLNLDGELGVGNVTQQSSPILVLGGFKWRSLGGAGMAIRTTGDAYAWGWNGSGECGLGDVIARSSPVLVLGGLKWRMVVAGGTGGSPSGGSFGIDSNGDLYAWGANTQGGLGVGGVLPRSSPVIVLGGLKWKWVSAVAGSTYGITDTNDLYAWGGNVNGQLGLGDVTPRSSPVIVLGGLKWRMVAGSNGGNSGPCAAYGIDLNGNAYAWGINTNGGLGVGDVTPRSSPVLVLGGLKFRNIMPSNGTAAVGISCNGSAYAWGLNSVGQLGLGDVVPRSSPVVVLGGLQWRCIDQALVSDLLIEVVPGTAYTVTVYAPYVQLGGTPLYTDETYVGSMQVRLVLEYNA